MKNRALLSAVALCFAVAGCESKKVEPAQPKVVTDKVVPVPSAAPTAPPASGNQDAKPGKVGASAYPPGCTQGNCKVWMDVTGTDAADCKIWKQPDPLYVHKANQNGTINFMVRTNGWSFDANGVAFTTGGITCTADPSNPKKYNCANPNNVTGVSSHNYTVRLKHTSGKTCTKDPSVVNGVDDAQATPTSEPAVIS